MAARTVSQGGDGFWRVSGEPSTNYYGSQAKALAIAGQLDAADLVDVDKQIAAADDVYILTKAAGVDSSGGTVQTNCVGAIVGDVVASWLRLDATGGSDKGTFQNGTDLSTAMFVSPVTVNAKLHQMAGVADQTGYQFLVLLKRSAA